MKKSKMVKLPDAGQEVLQRNRLQDRKYQKFHRRFQVKSKTDRQQWWANLSEDEKTAYIEGAQQRKAIKREDKTRVVMVKYGNKFSCSTCFHRFGGSCTDKLPQACPYWYNPDSTFQGIAYK